MALAPAAMVLAIFSSVFPPLAMTGTSGAPALMNWGMYRYAHRSIREYFTLGTGLGFSLLLQLAWCLALGAVGVVFWNISLKKITVNGG